MAGYAATRQSGAPAGLGWLSIVRLGLVQASLGSIVVLTTSVLNRVMVVELMLAAVIPGLLVGLHYGVQISRPLWGHGSDRGGRRTPWIVGGILCLRCRAPGPLPRRCCLARISGWPWRLRSFVLP
jgi:BCD family chlorophyll transporter-like MFS transporter